MRMRHLAAAGVAALLLAGCGGHDATTQAAGGSGSAPSSGVAHPTGPKLVDAAAAELTMAGSARAVMTTEWKGQRAVADLRLQGSDGIGTLTLDGIAMDVMATGGKSYIRASAAFWRAEGASQAAALRLDNRWVITPPGLPGQFGVTTFDDVVQEFLQPSKGVTVRDQVGDSTLNGTRVLVVTMSDGSTLYVAAEGESYPLELDKTGADGATLVLSEFGRRVQITAPVDALDLSQSGTA